MIAVWTVLGILTGIATALPFRAGVGDVVGKAIAGVLVYSLLGGAISLFATRSQESMVGGLCGLFIGLVAELTQPSPTPGQSVSLCLTIGGLIGATCWPWIRAIQAMGRFLAGLVRSRRTAR
jgi:hypothetical protein